MADNKDKKVLNVPDKREQNDACISSAEREEQVTKAQPKGNVPALRFPEFTGEWQHILNKELFNSVSEKNKNKIITLILSASQTEGMIERDNIGIDIKFDENSVKNYKIVRKGDYVIHLRSFQGGFAFSELTGICSPAYTILRPNKQLQYGFLRAYFMSKKFINSLRLVTYGIRDGKSISVEEWMQLYTNIPNDKEQNKIIKLFNVLDERIRLQNKIIEKYESLIQAMCDTLIRRETLQVKLSFGDFGQSYSGLSGKSAEDFGDGYPFITYMNVYQNQIIDSTDVGLVKINETEQQSVVRYGDILLTLSSETPEEVGMGAVYFGETYPLYLNSFCFGIHITDEAKIYPPFLAYYVSSQSFRKAVYPLAQGSTRFNLQKSDFMKKKFPFPVIEKQRKIYSILNTYSDKLIVEKQIMKLLCNQKCYLLRQLFI